ncbi:hypothetical protein PCE1_000996 [Barthelona sp. PCE]
MDIDKAIETVLKCECLPLNEYKLLLMYVKEIFAQEPNILHVTSPISVVGDIHGQFFDLLKLFEVGGELPNTKYVFLGDYVDRGYYSIQTITYLLLLKAKYPSRITLIRGNHESRGVTFLYGFYKDMADEYGTIQAWQLTMEVFDHLPVGALIDQTKLCIHGGLSPDAPTIESLQNCYRIDEIPIIGPLADVAWSDPDAISSGFAKSGRGAGHLFGESEVNCFCHGNDVDIIIRAHQMMDKGFNYHYESKKLVTVWSAPNYCYRYGNAASVMVVDNQNVHFKVFTAVPASQRMTPEAK